MPIKDKIKNVASKAKSFVLEHKQAVFNTVMFVGVSGVAVAVSVLTRESTNHYENARRLSNRQDYSRERIYDIERHAGMPVNSDDQRYHDYRQSLEADPDKQ